VSFQGPIQQPHSLVQLAIVERGQSQPDKWPRAAQYPQAPAYEPLRIDVQTSDRRKISPACYFFFGAGLLERVTLENSSDNSSFTSAGVISGIR
jgi:hypothetical protein